MVRSKKKIKNENQAITKTKMKKPIKNAKKTNKHKKDKEVKSIRRKNSKKRKINHIKHHSLSLVLFLIFIVGGIWTYLFYEEHKNTLTRNYNTITKGENMKTYNQNLGRNMNLTVRPSALAGTWYPKNPSLLEMMIKSYLNKVTKEKIPGELKALIVPHAGYIYSGIVAAKAYKQISKAYKKIIILGTPHHYPLYGTSIANVSHYHTPLGNVPLHKDVDELLKDPLIKSIPEVHKLEHSIEIQLPFLQVLYKEFNTTFYLIPIVVGQIDYYKFAELLNKFIDNDTLIVVSGDLSHYHPYEVAKEIDNQTISAVLNLSFDLPEQGTCNPFGFATLIALARMNHWQAKLLDYKNSGDTAGNKANVVGYSAIAFYAPQPSQTTSSNIKTTETKRDQYVEMEEEYSKEDKIFMLKLARRTLEEYLSKGKKIKLDPKDIPKQLKEKRGCFVTLNKFGQLRGCIGYILPIKPLYEAIIDNAINAAVNDPRFYPVQYEELKDINIEISILTLPKKLEFSSWQELLEKLKPMDNGVILKRGFHEATYLPQVWEHFYDGKKYDKEAFLSSLCRKAGMEANCWKDPSTKVEVYKAIVFSENEIKNDLNKE